MLLLLDKLHKVGLKGGCIYKAKGSYFRLQFSLHDSLRLYDFMYNQCDLTKNDLFLVRKKNIFEKYRKFKDAAVV